MKGRLGQLPLSPPQIPLARYQPLARELSHSAIEEVRLAVVLVVAHQHMFDRLGMRQQVDIDTGHRADANVIAILPPRLRVELQGLDLHLVETPLEPVSPRTRR